MATAKSVIQGSETPGKINVGGAMTANGLCNPCRFSGE
ncbi:hypothetical protein KKY_2858 [Pelagibacterium halotolerans B2]|uniref:Uncharacterized protein n=1 Tax=Pelagibacterium halotolerans (strain DSM 22347 / JCM 15775 / CGMCC 1.7692 / B2) TaxID=1082931 RepID=G4REB8_PELHB|nr:hypothetical protein KKY_2858 [Pelagibacterium halotolerans B2]